MYTFIRSVVANIQVTVLGPPRVTPDDSDVSVFQGVIEGAVSGPVPESVADVRHKRDGREPTWKATVRSESPREERTTVSPPVVRVPRVP